MVHCDTQSLSACCVRYRSCLNISKRISGTRKSELLLFTRLTPIYSSDLPLLLFSLFVFFKVICNFKSSPLFLVIVPRAQESRKRHQEEQVSICFKSSSRLRLQKLSWANDSSRLTHQQEAQDAQWMSAWGAGSRIFQETWIQESSLYP